MSEKRPSMQPAQKERIALLLEEAAEVIQVCGKILRHGMHSCHPVSQEPNQYLLRREICDLLVAIEAIKQDIPEISDGLLLQAAEKKYMYLHYPHPRLEEWVMELTMKRNSR